jgi:hypothetical protein
MQPDNRHGDERHITMQDLVDAAEANNKGAYQALQNIQQTASAVLDGQLESTAVIPRGVGSSQGAPD